MEAAGFHALTDGSFNYYLDHEHDKWWTVRIDWEDDPPVECGWEYEYNGGEEHTTTETVEELREEITNILHTDTLLAMEMKLALQDILKRNRDEALRLVNHPRLSGLAKKSLEE